LHAERVPGDHDAPGFALRRIVIQGEDDSVFVLNIGVHGSATVVSLVCVSMPTSEWPYMVTMWARGPPLSSKAEIKRDVVRMAANASSSPSPGAVSVEELTCSSWCWGHTSSVIDRPSSCVSKVTYASTCSCSYFDGISIFVPSVP
jgi:hypothetical protein